MTVLRIREEKTEDVVEFWPENLSDGICLMASKRDGGSICILQISRDGLTLFGGLNKEYGFLCDEVGRIRCIEK